PRVDLSSECRRSSAGPWSFGEIPGGWALEGPDSLLRVLSWRRWARCRSESSDRMDRRRCQAAPAERRTRGSQRNVHVCRWTNCSTERMSSMKYQTAVTFEPNTKYATTKCITVRPGMQD